MALANITITAIDADKQIIVNGEDLTDKIRAARIDILHNETPRVQIEFQRPETIFHGDGIVEVVRTVEADPFEAVKAWVGQLDAERLGERAAALSDWGTAPGEGWKLALLELLGEAQ